MTLEVIAYLNIRTFSYSFHYKLKYNTGKKNTQTNLNNQEYASNTMEGLIT